MAISKDHPHWQRMQFKGNKVWIATNEDQQPLQENGKVLVKYQLNQPHEYWVHPSKVSPLEADGSTAPPQGPRGEKRKAAKGKNTMRTVPETTVSEDACARAICIYTDGACSGNPGPAGIGAVLRYKGKSKEISRYIGMATNNIAELEAIRVALEEVKNRALPVILFTDSSYALGLLTKDWKARENQVLVQRLRELAATFRQLTFVKVKGHAGHPDNERADRLAVQSLNGKK
ncbi:MAG: ribonuclease H [Desulfosarcina sp.]